jgi:hypothetical protein
MKRVDKIGLALLTVFAIGVVAASSAQAETAPFFTVTGTRLVAGKTHNIQSKATASFVLTDESGSSKITCTGLSITGGVMLGSNAGTSGSASKITDFTGCTLEGNAPKGEVCHLAPSEGSSETSTTITTNEIRSEQVENLAAGTKGGTELLAEFYPASKGAGFVKINFGGECTLKSTIASGSVVAKSVLDASGEGQVELGQTPQERTSWKLNFPATPIKHVWLVSGGVGKAVMTGLEAFNEGALQTGTGLVSLANTKFEATSELWSPLP